MKRLLLISLVLLLVIASACSQNQVQTRKNGEFYTSFLPPKTAEVGEEFSVDASNLIRVNSIRREENQNSETILIISYDWINNSNSPQSVGENIRLSVKQKDLSLSPDLSMIDDRTPLVTQIGPGERLENISQGFISNSEDQIHLSFMGKEKVVFIDGRPTDAYPVELVVDFPDN